MKKLIGIALLSGVAMLAAPKAQNTPATGAPTVKKVHKKHVKKVKSAVKPAAAVAPTK